MNKGRIILKKLEKSINNQKNIENLEKSMLKYYQAKVKKYIFFEIKGF